MKAARPLKIRAINIHTINALSASRMCTSLAQFLTIRQTFQLQPIHFMKAIVLLISTVLLAAAFAFSDRFKNGSADKAFVLAAADGGMLEIILFPAKLQGAGN